MKAYITKYALTDGILEVEGDADERSFNVDYKASGRRFYCSSYFHEGEYELSLIEAQTAAEKMRRKRIDSLKKQIKKLESLRVKVVPIENNKAGGENI